MAEYTSKTISYLIDKIEKEDVVLPAIQREFVWTEDKICDLFDSLMRDYPIGTFLFWDIDSHDASEYILNRFINCYDEQEPRRGTPISPDGRNYIGVLDGQQRITSIYLGLTGYYRKKIKRRRWNRDDSFEKKFLCLDVMKTLQDNDDKYHLAFKAEEDIDKICIEELENDDGTISEQRELWIKVSDICKKDRQVWAIIQEKLNGINDKFTSEEMGSYIEVAQKLYNAIYNVTNVNFYEATNKDLSEVVDIFVRVNSGGQKLSSADLMLSVAAGVNQSEDIHKQMTDAIKYLDSVTLNPNTGLKFDKSMILTAGLYLTDASTLSLQKKENYSRDQLTKILDKWDDIIDALKNAILYIEFNRFDVHKLTSKNIILPIAYFFYMNKITDAKKFYNNGADNLANKVCVRQWILRAMINSLFRDGIGSRLVRIREVLKGSVGNAFPLKELMDVHQKNMLIGEDEIEDILNYEYGNGIIKPLLLELSDWDRGLDLHVDHIWSDSMINKKQKLKRKLGDEYDALKDTYKKLCPKLPNLQLLRASENEEKYDKSPNEWIAYKHKDENDTIYKTNCIPTDGPFEFNQFTIFFDKRKELLRARLKEVLPKSYEEIAKKYGI